MSQHYCLLFWCFVCLAVVVKSSGIEDTLLVHIGSTGNMDDMGQSSLIYWLIHQCKWIMKVVFKISSLPILPFLWMTGWLWRHLVLTPVTLAVHATHVMYPILIYCGAACLCGLIIGGCSGFAAEAMSSAVINATWGKQTIEKVEQHQQQQQPLDDQDDTATIYSQDTYDINDDETESSMSWRRASQHSPASSMYRFSISSDTYMTSSSPSSFYDDKPTDYQGDEDPEEIASFLRQRRKYHQLQQQQQQS